MHNTLKTVWLTTGTPGVVEWHMKWCYHYYNNNSWYLLSACFHVPETMLSAFCASSNLYSFFNELKEARDKGAHPGSVTLSLCDFEQLCGFLIFRMKEREGGRPHLISQFFFPGKEEARVSLPGPRRINPQNWGNHQTRRVNFLVWEHEERDMAKRLGRAAGCSPTLW